MEPQKDITIKDENQLDIRKMAVFQNDSSFFIIHKKSEKIASATYMITNFFIAEEPLKWSLRDLATKIIKDSVSLGAVSLSLRDGLVRSLSAKIFELISLYEVAYKAGFISLMNSGIIKQELENMLLVLEKMEDVQVGTKSVSFDPNFFAVPNTWVAPSETVSPALKTFPQTAHTEAEYSQKKVLVNNPHSTQSPMTSSEKNKRGLSFIKDNQKDIKNKRQDIIIALVKKNHSMNIKGFTGVIKGCSEKTIQRELLTLVAKRVLKKEGERRWSTYSLA